MDYHHSISYRFSLTRRGSSRSCASGGTCSYAAETSNCSDGDQINSAMVTEFARLPSLEFDCKPPADNRKLRTVPSCTNTTPFSRDVVMGERVQSLGRYHSEAPFPGNNSYVIAGPKSPPPSQKSQPPMSLPNCTAPSATAAGVNAIFHHERSPPRILDVPDTIECPRPGRKIEIAPGVYTIVRGAAETEEAVRNDFFSPVECPICSDTIFCIADADMYLCPECRSVCPTAFPAGGKGGVGLGFGMNELARIQQSCLNRCQ